MIDELIERVEKGEGADRELDLAVLNVVSTPPYRWSHVHAIIGGPNDIAVRGLPSDWEPEFVDFALTRDDASPVVVPRYTVSVDAVLALIEEKLPGWQVYGFEREWNGMLPSLKDKDRSRAWLERTRTSYVKVEAEAASPARALLAAFLKAHKEQHDDR